MDRFLADHAVNGTLTAENQHPLPDEDLRIPAADSAEIKEAVFVDVGNLNADFIDVPGEHYPRFPLSIQGRHRISVHVDPHVIGELPDLLPPDSTGCLLEPRRPRRIEE